MMKIILRGIMKRCRQIFHYMALQCSLDTCEAFSGRPHHCFCMCDTIFVCAFSTHRFGTSSIEGYNVRGNIVVARGRRRRRGTVEGIGASSSQEADGYAPLNPSVYASRTSLRKHVGGMLCLRKKKMQIQKRLA